MASNKRAQSIVSVNYRCIDCGALFGDPEQKHDFALWLFDVVNHWTGRHGLTGFKEGMAINGLLRPVYVWI